MELLRTSTLYTNSNWRLIYRTLLCLWQHDCHVTTKPLRSSHHSLTFIYYISPLWPTHILLSFPLIIYLFSCHSATTPSIFVDLDFIYLLINFIIYSSSKLQQSGVVVFKRTLLLLFLCSTSAPKGSSFIVYCLRRTRTSKTKWPTEISQLIGSKCSRIQCKC